MPSKDAQRLDESRPGPGEVEVEKSKTDAITKKRTFEYFNKPTTGTRFHIFRTIGEQLVGKVIAGPIANVRRNSSYAIELETGEVVEVFANTHLHKCLHQCMGEQVRIVFVGRDLQEWSGHALKVYRVYRVKRQGDTVVGERKRRSRHGAK